MKSVTFKNKMNGEQFVCDNTKAVELIDGIEYVVVHRAGSDRHFLIKKDALEKVDTSKERTYNR
jgi:predicted Zn-dependent protease with MMP-like domain